MLILTWASAIFTAGNRPRRARAQRSRGRVVLDRVTDALFYRRVGLAGTFARMFLLAVAGILSYMVGAGLGAVMLKAPIPVALIIGAVLVGWANSDPNVD